jgi:23S rRNA (cytosine1962-C5)-methyltransferase
VRWTIDAGAFVLELRPTSSGQVGCFPEHAATWGWLADLITAQWRATGRATSSPAPAVLNLFGYTGGATLAAASAGAAVTHVDAQRAVVAWARRNADLSGLDQAPVRWIVDDAPAFAARELRRGRRYGAIVLDPPSYGHGVGGRPWRIELDLPPLLRACVALGGPGGPDALLLTCHSPGLGPGALAGLVRDAWPGLSPARLSSGWLEVRSRHDRRLPGGAMARVEPA